MRFIQWLESNNQIQQMPITSLLMRKDEIAAAVSNLSRGLSSMTQGPLIVNYHKPIDKYQLTNGYHRVIEALIRGQETVPVINEGVATWSIPPKTEWFIPDMDSQFFGMEDFIEYYELKRLM